MATKIKFTLAAEAPADPAAAEALYGLPVGALALRQGGEAWARAWGFAVPPTEADLVRGPDGPRGTEAVLAGMGERLLEQARCELGWHQLQAAQRFANAAVRVARLTLGRGHDERLARALGVQAEIYDARGMRGRAASCRRRAAASGSAG
jgi:hypothetical protein